jgi:hypothetical protein
MNVTKLADALLGAVLLVSASVASGAATSTFDAGTEGWEVGDFFATSGAATPSHFSSGGNPGGFLSTGDIFSWNAWQAPAAFLGNHSSAYGQTLHVEQRTNGADAGAFPLVVLSDGTLMLQFRTLPPAPGNVVWTLYDVPLLASGGWEIANGSGGAGPAASEAQLQQVLGNIAFLNLNADWLSGADVADLDNVRLGVAAAIPEPSTYALMIAGLALVGFMANRRRKAEGNAATC